MQLAQDRALPQVGAGAADAASGSIGPYRLLRVLGRGGMGVVYLAEHEGTGERVALKTVQVRDHTMLSSIRREVHALRRIDHPGVVRVVAEGVAEGVPWYAMELLEGMTLRERGADLARGSATLPAIDSRTVSPEARSLGLHDSDSDGLASARGGLTTDLGEFASDGFAASSPAAISARTRRLMAMPPLAETLGLLRRVCDALAFVHGMGLVHRDLKPENVFIRTNGDPVLVDFGLASSASGATPRDVIEIGNAPAGSPEYMAPEQILGELTDARTDLYALGCILYECVTGAPPFDGSVPTVLRHQIHTSPEPPSRRTSGDVPAALDELILRLLQKRPQDRLGHADDVAAALEAAGAPKGPAWPRGRPYLYRPELAGRSAALGRVTELVLRAKQRSGSRVLVGGESGVGKSRFATEVATLASHRGLRVIIGECAAVSAGDREALRAAPLHPFRNFLVAVEDRCREIGEAETARLLGDHGRVLVAVEPSLARLPGWDHKHELPTLHAQAARARLVRALVATLVAFAETEPLVLLIDDLQWADESTMAVLGALDAETLEQSPLVVLATYRTDEATDGLRELCAAPSVLAIELGRLDADAVSHMVSDMLAMRAPAPELVDYLVEESAGNPFFIAEYLRVAIDERVLARDLSGEWRVAGASVGRQAFREALPLPRELRALVTRRVGSLSPSAQALARVAAVLGREFEADLLAAAAVLDDLPSLEAIEELRARQVLEVAGSRLRFVHDKLREIVAVETPEDQRRSISGVAARAVVARYGGGPEIAAFYPFLAHHFGVAREDAEALVYLEKAGEHALDTGASADALGFFRGAIDLDDRRRQRGDEPVSFLRRASWERRLGQAEFNLGDMREAERFTLDALHRLRTRRARVGRTGVVLTFLTLLAHLARQMWLLFGRRAPVEGTPPALPPLPDDERRRLTEASLAAERLGEVYFFQGEPLRSFTVALLSANLAEPLGASPELARSYSSLSIAFGLVPFQRAVAAYEERARAAAHATGDPQAISWVHFLLTLSAIGTARWEVAREAGRLSVELARAVQDHRRFEECMALLSDLEFMVGRFAEAMRMNDDLFASARRSGNRQGEFWALTTRAWCLMWLGRFDEANDPMDRAHRLVEHAVGDESQNITLGEGALLSLLRGDHVAAERLALTTLGHMERMSPSAFHVGWGYAATCEVFLALAEGADGAERRRLVRNAASAVRAMRSFARIFPVGRPGAHRYDGLLHRIHGRPARAQASFARSIAEAEQLGMPIDAAQARYDASRALPPGDPARTEHLRRALASFTEHGAAHWAGLVEAALAGDRDPSPGHSGR